MRAVLYLALGLLLLPGVAAAQNCLCLRCVLGPYTNYSIPTGAMRPFLEPGECVIARETLTDADLWPGQVIFFTEGPQDIVFTFRIVATAGQTVQMRAGRLWVDGAAVPTKPVAPYVQVMSPEGPHGSLPLCPGPTPIGGTCKIGQLTEQMPGVQYGVLDTGAYPLDDTRVFTVPEGHVFVLGDNRDNAMDSRRPAEVGGRGFVPVDRIVGVYEEHN